MRKKGQSNDYPKIQHVFLFFIHSYSNYIFLKLFQKFVKSIIGRYENKEHVLTFTLCYIESKAMLKHYGYVSVYMCIHTHTHYFLLLCYLWPLVLIFGNISKIMNLITSRVQI